MVPDAAPQEVPGSRLGPHAPGGEPAGFGDAVASIGRGALADLTSGLQVAWVGWDLFAATASVVLAHAATPYGDASSGLSASLLALHALAVVVSMLSMGLYEPYRLHDLRTTAVRTGSAIAVAWTVTLGVLYLVQFGTPLGRWIVAIGNGVGLVLALAPRALVSVATRRSGLLILLIGDEPGAAVLRDVGRHKPHIRTRVIGPLSGRQLAQLRAQSPRLLESLDAVVVQRTMDAEAVEGALKLIGHGVAVHEFNRFIEDTYQVVPVEKIDLDWFLEARVRASRPHHAVLRHAVDAVVAAMGLLLTLPLWPLIAGAVRLSGPGPVFYRQLRVGQAGRQFRLLKFRTMRSDAEADGLARWAVQNDARVTRVGRILRKTRLDELPQFLNVLRGDMSFVGPRPERPEFVDRLSRTIPHYGFRHLVKPGITGWAQIRYRYGASEQDALEKLRYDLFYIKNSSPLMDLEIVLRTVWAVAKGAR